MMISFERYERFAKSSVCKSMDKFVKINLAIIINIGLANNIVDFIKAQIDILALKKCF